MEPAEDASLEPAIGWLAQSILASPLINEQAPWVREAGLAEEMEGLKSEIKGVQLVVSVIKGRALGNEPLSESLVQLKEQLDQEGTLPSFPSTFMFPSGEFDPPETDGHGTQPVERSTKDAAAQRRSFGKLRSKLWKEFEILEFDKKNGAPVRAKCNHCDTELGCPTKQGTGVLQNHLNSKACPYDALSITDATTNPAPVATANLLSSKKRRRDEESTCLITANTNRWNKDEFSKMIQDITLKLRHIREGLIPVLSVLGSGVDASSSHIQGPTSHQHRRTSGTFQGRVYGRDSEKNKIIKLIEEKKSSAGVTVLPILGIAGIGKTALAQLVYNDPAVKDQFDHMLWIWISNSFDAMELTKDMLGYVSEETAI